ncbi:hypothetical protein C8F01DRAFT_1130891, partial [Mycena amicta]
LAWPPTCIPMASAQPMLALASLLSSAPRQRAPIACVRCRRRKIKCVTSDTLHPCARCTKRGLQCEYMAVSDPRNSFASTSGSTSPPSPASTSSTPTPSTPTSPEAPIDATSWDVISLDSVPIPWPDQDNISPQAARWPAFPSGSFQGSHPQYSPQYSPYSNHYPQVALHYPGGNPYAIQPISSQWAPLPNTEWAAAWDVPPHPPRSSMPAPDHTKRCLCGRCPTGKRICNP